MTLKGWYWTNSVEVYLFFKREVSMECVQKARYKKVLLVKPFLKCLAYKWMFPNRAFVNINTENLPTIILHQSKVTQLTHQKPSRFTSLILLKGFFSMNIFVVQWQETAHVSLGKPTIYQVSVRYQHWDSIWQDLEFFLTWIYPSDGCMPLKQCHYLYITLRPY